MSGKAAAPAARGNGGGGGGGRRDFLRLALLVARRDYVRTVRRRGYIFGTLLLPAGIALLMFVSGAVSFAVPQTDPGMVRLVIVNESSVPIVNEPAVVSELLVLSRDEALEMLDDGRVTAVYVVPAGFPRDRQITRLEATSGVPQLGALEASSVASDVLAALLRTSILRDAGLSEEAAAEATAPILVTVRTPEGEEVSELAMAATFIVPLVFTLLFVMSIFITSGYLLQSVTEEKENRVVEIVLSSVPALPLMAGKLAGLGAAGLTQVVVWVVTALVALLFTGGRLGPLTDLPITLPVLVLAVVYFVLGYLAFGAIFAAIGALAPGNREAQQYSGFFGFFAVIPLVLSGLFLTDQASLIVVLLALFPLTAPATMLQVIAVAESPPLPLLVASMISLSLFVVVATIACARIFRATVLLYGARPSVRQLLGAVRTGG